MRTQFPSTALAVAKHFLVALEAGETEVPADEQEVSIGLQLFVEADSIYRALLWLERHGALTFERHRSGHISTRGARRITLHSASPVWTLAAGLAALDEVTA